MTGIEHTIISVIMLLSAFMIGKLLGKRAGAIALATHILSLFKGDEIFVEESGIYVCFDDGSEFKLVLEQVYE
jgi:hypothetical protein